MNHAGNMLDRMLEPLGRSLTAESARRIVELRADPAAQGRMDELAQKCNEGQVSEDEKSEYEAYVVAGNVIAILQAKARAALARHSAA